MKLLKFTLSMPNIGSWDGKWTGEGRNYCRVRRVKGKLPSKDYYHYNFGDGWSAGVSVREVTAKEARHARKHTAGFAGYDWMIDSILKNDKIIIEKNQRLIYCYR